MALPGARHLQALAEPAIRRIVMAGAAGVLLTAPLSVQQVMPLATLPACLLTVAGGWLAMRSCSRGWTPSPAATLAAVVVCVVFAAATLVEGTGQVVSALRQTDAQILCVDDVSPAVVASGREVLAGTNPYTAYNALVAEQSLGCPGFHATAARSGIFATRTAEPTVSEVDAVARTAAGDHTVPGLLLGFYYPAGTALVGMVGAHALVLLNIVLLLGAAAVVVAASPRQARPWMALALAAQTGALLFIGPGHPDGIVAALLMAACLWRRPLPGGVALGLACAIKQTAWFIAPGLLILAFRERRGAAVREAAVAAGVFAIVNFPFAVPDARAWLDGILTPQSSPLFPQGRGPVGIFVPTDRVALLTTCFTVLMLLTLAGGWVLVVRGRRGWAEAGVVLASLGLWDGPRSLEIYIALLGVVAVSMCARSLTSRAAPATAGAAGRPRLR